ncbi:MAG: DUF1552 domain-containing protein [Vicinamibacterales bacterium]
MFISKMALPRRTVLRGMGATLALPFLEAMVPALTATAQTAANRPRRFGVVFVPLGERPGFWTPKTVGADFEFTQILKPIEKFRQHVTVVSELCDPLDGHATTVSAWLSGAIPKKTFAEDVYSGETVDQVIARKIGQETPLPSLELATEDFTGYVGGCDTQYSCAYMNTISWSSATSPVPMEINPRVVFERLFGRPGTSAQRQQRMQTDKSILDSLGDDVKELERGLGTRDLGRLHEYLDRVREVERRIQLSEQTQANSVLAVDAPLGIPETWEEHALLMYDLAALAYQADITRVLTYMKAKDASMISYTNLGVSEPHHSTTHHLDLPESVSNLVKINTYHMSLFARFLETLSTTPDGDGSLLDHSLILFGSGMSEANTHSRLDIPTLLVGGGGVGFKGNRHIQTTKETPFANCLLALANRFGCELQSFGTLSTGELAL